MPPGGLLFKSSCTCCEDSCFLSRVGAAFGRAVICMGLWHPPAVQLRQVCIFGRRFHTHTGGVLVHKYTYLSLSLMWLCFFKLIQYPTEVNGRCVKPTSLLMRVPICMSTSLFLKQTTVLSRLQPFSHLLLRFSVRKHCICFASLKSSLAMQETHLCQWSIQPQHLRKKVASSRD